MGETTARTLSLLTLLQSHRWWPGEELAERLGVTTRSLRRRIDALRELGYEIESTPGIGGGYRLGAGNRMPPLLLTDDEAVSVAVGLRIAATTGIVDGESTALSALAKFEQVLPPAVRERVNALGGSIRPQGPRGGPIASALLGALALACRDNERIRFPYTAAGGEETRRHVEPHSLVSAQRKWFLVAWDLERAAWRTFRVDRIGDVLGTGVRAEPRSLSAEEVAELTFATPDRTPRHTAHAIIAMPLDAARAHFGPWAQDARAVDADHTAWPFGGDDHPSMTYPLVWIPEGVPFTIQAPRDYLEFLHEYATRLLAAATTSLSHHPSPPTPPTPKTPNPPPTTC
ncbi:WYL domain-containing protein [Actinocorallia sp. API 0066]|uniref:helix-turn-helix transcriptional regulator n=1 Tax=Actinocorallia sp. API 0066 TaxID=2896846 RepID=UPI001E4F7A52|nr:WYL domain-containing protein [Actinocorallia sp. API 0066]MCD0451535.1 WYL domain-containing protein [Actinocorallia sp. API 0066]